MGSELTPGEYQWLFGLLVVALIGTFAYGLRYMQRARLINDTPTSRIRSAPQGYVEIEGRARPGGETGVLSAPLSGMECVWFDARVERRQRLQGRRNHNTRWVQVSRDTSSEPVKIDDGTGEALIFPDGARTHMSHHRVWYGDSENPLSGVTGGFWSGRHRYRYTETLLLDHEPTYVIGEFSTSHHDYQADKTRRVRELLNAWKSDPAQMKRFDLDGSGHISEREWEMARRLAKATVRREIIGEAVERSALNVMRRPRDGRPFIIASVPQAMLARRKKRWGLTLWGISALIAGTLGYLIQLRGLPF